MGATSKNSIHLIRSPSPLTEIIVIIHSRTLLSAPYFQWNFKLKANLENGDALQPQPGANNNKPCDSLSAFDKYFSSIHKNYSQWRDDGTQRERETSLRAWSSARIFYYSERWRRESKIQTCSLFRGGETWNIRVANVKFFVVLWVDIDIRERPAHPSPTPRTHTCTERVHRDRQRYINLSFCTHVFCSCLMTSSMLNFWVRPVCVCMRMRANMSTHARPGWFIIHKFICDDDDDDV